VNLKLGVFRSFTAGGSLSLGDQGVGFIQRRVRASKLLLWASLIADFILGIHSFSNVIS
jgi:hypothetical protein